MMEVNWGQPLTLVVSNQGNTQRFSTIEQAQYWLRQKWPVADFERDKAIALVDAAMHCLAPVRAARDAFVSAARTAGFKTDAGEGSARGHAPTGA